MNYFTEDLDKQIEEMKLVKLSEKSSSVLFKKEKKKKQKVVREYNANIESSVFMFQLYRNIKTKKKKVKKVRKKTRSYKTYIDSPLWEKRKNTYYQNHKRECGRCFSTERIQLHHVRYDKKVFGKEKDQDLIPLCDRCHNEFHKNHKTKKDMSKETTLFITTFVK